MTLLRAALLYWLTSMSTGVDGDHFHVYFTDHHYGSDLMHDCFYYNLADDLPDYEEGWHGLSQIIPYCVRSKTIEQLTFSSSNVNAIYTFNELHQRQITSQQLYDWFAPIDLVERYQLYLNNLHELWSNQTFKNCSSKWYGEFCQFHFEEDGTLPDIVKISFLSKREQAVDLFKVTNLTCYTHLNCSLGPEPLCLDWRDICDGKTDCMNDNVDERFCTALETNMCDEDQYQCHNGQCIPNELFNNDHDNPDCLDGSDERNRFACDEDPSMRCEDRYGVVGYIPSWRQGIAFNCGDGTSAFLGSNTDCSNRRKTLFDQTIFAQSNNRLLTIKCWLAMFYYLEISDYLDISMNINSPCFQIDEHCFDFISIHCPPLFRFPSSPILFGHVYLYYSNNRSVDESLTGESPARPVYVCYDEHLCPFVSWTIKINGSTCVLFNELSEESDWFDVIRDLADIFWACSNNGISEERCKDNGFYQCENSSKCISHRRLADGVFDCIDGSDEWSNYSCSVHDDLRFRCRSEDLCLSHLIRLDGEDDCLDGEDEILPTVPMENKLISFATMCDGFIEVNGQEHIKNHSIETDETNCDQWPCNNIYTRCDGYWNCKNGSDELNCPNLSSECATNEFTCISAETFELVCLSPDLADNGHVDCLGGSDERFYCRSLGFPDQDRMHRCWNSTECINIDNLCAHGENCKFGDDERYCNRTYEPIGICGQYLLEPEMEQHPSFQFLCQLAEYMKPRTVHFTLTERHNRSAEIRTDISQKHTDFRSRTYFSKGSLNVAWLCNRGLFVWRRIEGELDRSCLCPPAYYGYRCQFQNQRVSLSFRVRTVEWRTVFNIVIMLTDDDFEIHSYEQRTYLAFRDCNIQFGMNLLYLTQPRNDSKKYTLKIDVFDKVNLNHRATWEFPIQFLFLPVYRIATILMIPSDSSTRSKSCVPHCMNGECFLYMNTQRSFCRCFQGWFGSSCERSHHCHCENGSFCMGSQNNTTICVCPLGKHGPRCLLARSSCNPNPCSNQGLCIPADERIAENNFSCICKQGYTGMRCDQKEARIEISFSDMPIPTSIFIHYITVIPSSPSLRITMTKKIAFDQDSVILYQSFEYHIIFIEFSRLYYLAYVEPTYIPSTSLNLNLATSDYCPRIDKLFNATLMKLTIFGRMKYYHVPCREQIDLKCFHDEKRMCLCTNQRHANCFDFDHNMTYNCRGSGYCQNDAQCFQDHPTCPASRMCACDECFYGSRCQFSTKGFSLSLDAILGYQIRPHVCFNRQRLAVKVSVTVITILFLLGLINSINSIITFKSKNSREVGCGIYLLTSSIFSIFATIIFTLKFWLIVLIQMSSITSRPFISFSCITMDYFLQILLNANGWLYAAVSVERAVTVIKGANFNKDMSKRVARVTLFFLFCFVILTNIHDPLHRHLMDDVEEQRTWCVVSYSTRIQLFNSIMTIFHFLTPFILNVTCALVIIIKITESRVSVKKQSTYVEHLRDQLRQHRHLLISPIILIILSVPRLVISLITGCMKSARDPWIFLFSYLLSCVPSSLTFIIFVLPSEMYQREFVKTIRHMMTRATQFFNSG